MDHSFISKSIPLKTGFKRRRHSTNKRLMYETMIIGRHGDT